MTTAFERIVAEEMRQWGIGGIAVALVEDQRVVYAAGFGQARRDSIFRIGSISKLFNALAVMQQVEAGKLDLDAPLPLPFSTEAPVTLRLTLCHRGGLPRESPVGGYFDDSEPGLAATVASLSSCSLVTPPGAMTRYSNIAPCVAGSMVERVSGLAFEDYQRQRILRPLGMTDSTWTRHGVYPERLIPSWMRVADGRGGWSRQPAPVFDIGEAPAGNLFSTVDDMARFASALMAGGGGLVKPETLQKMFRAQFPREKQSGFGLGFAIGQFRDRRVISHTGAVYGYSSILALMPEEKRAVIVLSNEDLVLGRIRRITDAGFSQWLGENKTEVPPAPSELASLTGEYASQSGWARVEERDRRLVADISGQPTLFTPAGGLNFFTDSRVDNATPATFQKDGFILGSQEFQRVPVRQPKLPPEWEPCLGRYGPAFIPLIVSERMGRLFAMTENMFDYLLKPAGQGVFALPAGIYACEQAVFLPGCVNFANALLRRQQNT